MEFTLPNLFYAIGIVIFVIQLVFFIGVAVAAWYLYKWYKMVQKKISTTPALFLAQKVFTHPMKVGTGMMAIQLIGTLFKMIKKRRK